MAEKAQIGRLAMRVEGGLWVAYYAMPDTMQGAIFLGSIVMKAVENRRRKELFMGMMRDVVADYLEDATGERPTWDEPVTAKASAAAAPDP